MSSIITCLHLYFVDVYRPGTLKSILMSMNLKELYIDNADCYLKVKWNQLDIFYKDKNVDTSLFENKNDIIGIHWFNGAKDSKDYYY